MNDEKGLTTKDLIEYFEKFDPEGHPCFIIIDPKKRIRYVFETIDMITDAKMPVLGIVITYEEPFDRGEEEAAEEDEAAAAAGKETE